MSPARRCLLHSARITVQSTVVRPQSRRYHLHFCHLDVAHVIRPSSPMSPANLIPSPSSEGLLGTKGSLILLSKRCLMQ